MRHGRGSSGCGRVGCRLVRQMGRLYNAARRLPSHAAASEQNISGTALHSFPDTAVSS